ncbi:lysine exporter LysO family protein [Acidaminococcus sp. NSJ-142]|jgi:hypothetical protein|uniref:LysO family transporter n=1 Tax=Acidaminococcus TaxID=904 RepID=UPI000CF8AB69|nr:MULTISPECIES: LysO family transporter [Acidaminococcus]MCD2434397.1 lysine exporter LysO family protein [Acidaminococcus hominis]MCH4096789.1 lysine exporter LysO family protein [Acidaminococcus provencensis]RHJ98191.1 DUF340 domain-containing protein [Acidaminococcus sp. AM05-11]
MTVILLCMALGIAAGLVNLFSYKIKLGLSRISQAALCTMIFCLAAKIGSNPQLLVQLRTLGIQSLAICLGSMLGSFLLLLIVERIFAREIHTLFQEAKK